MRRDLVEAKECDAVGAFFASVTMSRRAIQGACMQKGAPPGKKLYEQIDHLYEERVITKDLKDWATAIRFVGNDGAHPNSDEVASAKADRVSGQDAKDMISLAEKFLEVLYVTPALAQEHLNRRKKT